ncbi:hypothetical protein [Thioalkalivibrio sp. ALJ15]|uniref:hypothetical protein n=1 Tax=Thioalkalivibrio sp. ALJ15 TaxID=748652 RepID=UPI0003764C28|nr:hypothetical protein [Thioalkalivibrio sp. ALJ15]
MGQQNMVSAGLPEKDWFSLDEIAERWGCSVDLLTHYAEVEMLRVCANFHQVTGMERTIYTKAKGEDSTLRDHELSAPVAGLFGIQACDIAHLNRTGGVRPRELFDPDQKYTTAADFFIFDEEQREEHRCSYTFIKTADTQPMWYEGGEQRPVWPDGQAPVDYVTKNMLLVTRVERDRFEKLYRIGAHAGELPANPGPGDAVYTESMRILLRASREFWSTAEPEAPKTHPSNDEIVDWLKGQGMSARLAESAASIIRPDWARVGRPRK